MGSLSAHAQLTYRSETSQPWLGEKPSPAGLPMFLHSSGGPLYGWKKRGIFAVLGSGQRGLRVCLHVRQVLAQRAQVFEPRGGRGLLIAG